MKAVDGLPMRGEISVRMSPMLLSSLVGAVLATVACVVLLGTNAPPPPPGPGSAPPGPPPSLAAPIAATAVAALCWAAVLIILVRDQLLRRIAVIAGHADAGATSPAALASFAESLRAQLKQDRVADLAAIETRLAKLAADFGEQRETEGFLNGMRAATEPRAMVAEVRPLRALPPPQ
jgi:hypothetical protein